MQQSGATRRIFGQCSCTDHLYGLPAEQDCRPSTSSNPPAMPFAIVCSNSGGSVVTTRSCQPRTCSRALFHVLATIRSSVGHWPICTMGSSRVQGFASKGCGFTPKTAQRNLRCGIGVISPRLLLPKVPCRYSTVKLFCGSAWSTKISPHSVVPLWTLPNSFPIRWTLGI